MVVFVGYRLPLNTLEDGLLREKIENEGARQIGELGGELRRGGEGRTVQFVGRGRANDVRQTQG